MDILYDIIFNLSHDCGCWSDQDEEEVYTHPNNGYIFATCHFIITTPKKCTDLELLLSELLFHFSNNIEYAEYKCDCQGSTSIIITNTHETEIPKNGYIGEYDCPKSNTKCNIISHTFEYV